MAIKTERQRERERERESPIKEDSGEPFSSVQIFTSITYIASLTWD